jgi:hypothetical protein
MVKKRKTENSGIEVQDETASKFLKEVEKRRKRETEANKEND